MLKKIFKTIFIMSICVGISIPTNAAVSVSDGSAFVTKAEFAADLNNLSNRMAQLENSLDAKIDSLVSSYLTRNGIWNGSKQQTNDYATVYSTLYTQFKVAIMTLAGRNDNGSQDSTDLIQWTVISQTTKTGLLDLTILSETGFSMGLNQGSGGKYVDAIWEGTFGGYLEIRRVVGTTYEVIGIVPSVLNVSTQFAYNNCYLTMASPKALFNTKTFVQKDDKIVARLILFYSGRRAGTTDFMNNFTASSWIGTRNVSNVVTDSTELRWSTTANVF